MGVVSILLSWFEDETDETHFECQSCGLTLEAGGHSCPVCAPPTLEYYQY